MGALRLLLLVGLLLLGQALGTGALEGAVATAIEGQLALLDMHHMVDHGIEKVTVVGDQQQGAGIALQPAFQPENGIQIQVVGRLVQQQQVGGAHQRLGQVQAHAPATGKVADPAIHLRTVKTQAGQQLARPGIGAVAVEVVQLIVQTGDGGAVMGSFGSGQFGLHPAQLHIAIEHIVHRLAFYRVHFLAHMGNAPSRGNKAVAAIGRQFAAQQGEQAGFAGTIGADQAGLVAGMQGQLGIFQQTLGATL